MFYKKQAYEFNIFVCPEKLRMCWQLSDSMFQSGHCFLLIFMNPMFPQVLFIFPLSGMRTTWLSDPQNPKVLQGRRTPAPYSAPHCFTYWSLKWDLFGVKVL